jgi:hypothetical protein
MISVLLALNGRILAVGGRAAPNHWLESLLADRPQGAATAAADYFAGYHVLAHMYSPLSVLPRLVSSVFDYLCSARGE